MEIIANDAVGHTEITEMWFLHETNADGSMERTVMKNSEIRRKKITRKIRRRKQAGFI